MVQRRRPEQDGTEVGDEETAADLRERLLHSVTLPVERLQEALDDAVRRGRMTRRDAEELVAALVSASRTQTEQLINELDQLLTGGRGSAARRRARSEGEKVLRGVKRAVGSSGVPIEGYDDLTAAQVTAELGDLTPEELRRVRDYEKRNANRKSVLGAVEKALK